MSKQVVLGLGEVGRAVRRVLEDDGATVYGIDQDISDVPFPDTPKILALHVCIPYTDGFVATVKSWQEILQVPLVIVHSTVKPDTCDPHGWVHSPVNGQHPYLAEDLLRFRKWFGGVRAEFAAALWPGESRTLSSALLCELAKVLDTTRYGWEIVWAKEAAALCEEYELPWESVLSLWTNDYNAGYHAAGKGRYQRSDLIPVGGPIGGHCVIPNLGLLPDSFFPAVVIENANHEYHREG